MLLYLPHFMLKNSNPVLPFLLIFGFLIIADFHFLLLIHNRISTYTLLLQRSRIQFYHLTFIILQNQQFTDVCHLKLST